MSNEENENEEKKVFIIPHTVKLNHSFTYGKDREVSTITFSRRLKAKDFKGINVRSMTMDDMMKLVSKTTGEFIAVIEELDASDIMQCVEVITSFLDNGQPTGNNG